MPKVRLNYMPSLQELTTLAYKTYVGGAIYSKLLTYHECELIFGVPC